jgi:hypothetical protein
MFNYANLYTSIIFILFLTSYAFGSDFQSPRTTALGGAGHAAPLLTDAIYLNPSYTSFSPTHAFSFNYLKYSGGVVDTPAGPSDYYGNNMNISILDGSPDSLFQAGVGYTRRNDANLIHLGASKSIVQKYGVGIGGKFIFPNDNSGDRFNDANISFSGVFAKWIQTALIVDNLLESAQSRGFYREYILGTRFNIDGILMIYIDPHYVPSFPVSDQKFGYEAGAEFPFFQDFYLRIGTHKNSNIPYAAARGDGVGFGAGWIGPKTALDYAYSHTIRPIPASVHTMGLSLYF